MIEALAVDKPGQNRTCPGHVRVSEAPDIGPDIAGEGPKGTPRKCPAGGSDVRIALENKAFPPPQPGQSACFDGQTFDCVAVEPYTRRDGTVSALGHWRSLCPSCTKPFVQPAGVGTNILRRCKPCRDIRGPYRLNRRERKNLA